MADVIEASASGRAKCRGCGRAIAKGELRFGESLANPYAEGEALYWFHLQCAACMRPEKFGPALATSPLPIDDRPWLMKTAAFGVEYRRVERLVRVERASSGRAHCRKCRELIEKGHFRIALQMFEEGRMSPIGTIHVACAEGYFGTKDILDRVERLTSDLSKEDLDEVARLLREAPPATETELRLAKTRAPAEPPGGEAGEDGRTTEDEAEPRSAVSGSRSAS